MEKLDDLIHQVRRLADAHEIMASQKTELAGSSNMSDTYLMSIENTLRVLNNTRSLLYDRQMEMDAKLHLD